MSEKQPEPVSPEGKLSQKGAWEKVVGHFDHLHNSSRMRVEERGIYDEATNSWTFRITAVPSGTILPPPSGYEEYLASFEQDVGCVTIADDGRIATQPSLEELDDVLQGLKNDYGETQVLRATLHGMLRRRR